MYVPFFRDVWFDLERGEDLKTRAIDVLTEYFRKTSDDDKDEQEAAAFKEQAWITHIDLQIAMQPIAPTPKEQEKRWFALLFGGEEMQGDQRLCRRITRSCSQTAYTLAGGTAQAETDDPGD